MSSDDYMVDPRKDSEVRGNGKQLRKFLGLTNVDQIDVLILEEVSEIWTEKGVKPFRLEVVPDEDLRTIPDSLPTTAPKSSPKYRDASGTTPSWGTATPDTPSPTNLGTRRSTSTS
jgi:hypothetical protein